MSPTVIHGDFLNVPHEQIGKIDLIIADPPDNIGLKYEDFDDNKSYKEYEQSIYLWLDRMINLTDGPIFFTFNQKWTQIVENAIKNLDIRLVQRIQWYYTFGQDQTRIGRYALCYRPIYWLNNPYVNTEKIKVPSARQTKYNDKRAAKGGKMPSNIWEFSRICGNNNERRKWVPTQLPEALVSRIILGHCVDNGRILDPFLGSGTTAIVSHKLGFDHVGIEISSSTAIKTSNMLDVLCK